MEAALKIFFCKIFPWRLGSFLLLSRIYNLGVSPAKAQSKSLF